MRVKMKKSKGCKKSKYNNLFTEKSGIIYHSAAEAEYSDILEKLKRAGIITKIDRQVSFKLPNFHSKRDLEYRADFVVTTATGKVHIIEVKGRMTDANKVKYAYVEYVHKIHIHIVPTKGWRRFDTQFIE